MCMCCDPGANLGTEVHGLELDMSNTCMSPDDPTYAHMQESQSAVERPLFVPGDGSLGGAE
eukprot:COSAG02_NODE_3717_length_6328_cov_6.689517_3_plen_61_part_00